MLEVRINGLDALNRALDELPAKLQANILRGAMRAGAKVVERAVKDAAPVRTGKLRDSVRTSSRLDRRTGQVVATVKAGGSGGKRAAYYAHMVEFGTQAHDIKPQDAKSLFIAGLFGELVHHPGATARPFMRPAMDATQSAAALAVAEYCRTRLTREGLDAPEVFLDAADDEGAN